MPNPPPDDDDPARDWVSDDDAATLIDRTAIELSPEDLAEIEREEKTPTVVVESLAGFEPGRRAGVYETIADVRALFMKAGNTPQFVDNLSILLARRARVPWPPKA